MNFRIVLNLLSKFIKFFGLLIFIPSVFSLIYREPDYYVFILSGSMTLVVGMALSYLFKINEEEEISRRDAFGVATLLWLSAAFFGAMPYIFAGTFESLIDAFFESMSGFTTCGASVLTNIEAQSHGILFWRQFTHWIGGIGIIVLAAAIFPVLNIGGMRLIKTEISGIEAEKIKPRITSTTKLLWGGYTIITALGIILLLVAGMPLFEAICHSFGAIATGGFSTKNGSISSFNNIWVEIIIILLMFAGGINFVLHYNVLTGAPKRLFKDEQFRFYFFLMLASVFLVSLNLLGYYGNFFTALRYASFQVCSINTATGFSTADFDRWPSFSRVLLILLMFIGGCAGSTSGGIKSIRVWVILKGIYQEIYRIIYPKAVFISKISNKVIDDSTVSSIKTFCFAYILLFIIGSGIMSLLGLNLISACTSVIATLGTVGPGMGLVGPMKDYAMVPMAGKVVLSLFMLIGRLELFTVLVIFAPSFWKE